MISLLSQIESKNVADEPFPHIIMPDCLPANLYGELTGEYPESEVILNGAEPGNNRRHQINAAEGLAGAALSVTWKEFVGHHVSPGFWAEVVAVFGPSIRRQHPDLEERMGKSLEDFSVAVRGTSEADVVLDCQPGLNTPVLRSNTVRGPHVDNPVELFGGLLYCRLPEDDSEGAELLLYRHRRQPPRFWGKAELRNADVEVVATVPYAANLMVMFINSVDAVHGVTPRAVTPHPRRLVNFIGEVYAGGGLFKLPRDRSLTGRIRNRWYQKRYGW